MASAAHRGQPVPRGVTGTPGCVLHLHLLTGSVMTAPVVGGQIMTLPADALGTARS
ncbi:MAG: hypothetical protein M3N95_04865 [Actinomycetota bacterium]|nr:hypothetical protein [Actinomycetota bacterium]